MKNNRIHHITVLAGEPQQHYDFYTDVLGLQLVKKTVNFDDTASYHLYFSNKRYNPNFIFTSFPSTSGEVGVLGGGQVGRIAFSVAPDSLNGWKEHFKNHQVTYTESNLFGLSTIEFNDPDGLRLALVADERVEGSEITGFYGVILHSRHVSNTKSFLNQLGFKSVQSQNNDFSVFETSLEDNKQIVMVDNQDHKQGWLRAGTVHHIAWAVEGEAELQEMKETLESYQGSVTDIKDRKYFKSIYSREPGHTLFEYATDGPGFLIDEPVDALGTELKLPDQYQANRAEIIAQLPELITDKEEK